MIVLKLFAIFVILQKLFNVIIPSYQNRVREKLSVIKQNVEVDKFKLHEWIYLIVEFLCNLFSIVLIFTNYRLIGFLLLCIGIIDTKVTHKKYWYVLLESLISIGFIIMFLILVW
jgi:hypothetical protein